MTIPAQLPLQLPRCPVPPHSICTADRTPTRPAMPPPPPLAIMPPRPLGPTANTRPRLSRPVLRAAPPPPAAQLTPTRAPAPVPAPPQPARLSAAPVLWGSSHRHHQGPTRSTMASPMLATRPATPATPPSAPPTSCRQREALTRTAHRATTARSLCAPAPTAPPSRAAQAVLVLRTTARARR